MARKWGGASASYALEYGTETLEIHTPIGMAPLRTLRTTKYRKAPESAILMPWAPVRLRSTRVPDEPKS
jgi:hypothetical protein